MTMERTAGTHWVYRLIPPRPTFDQDMIEAESEAEMIRIAEGDPAISSGMATYVIGAMPVTVVRR